MIFAYWTCFLQSKTHDINPTNNVIDDTVHYVSPFLLHNPTPIHPKANQIISYPATLTSVTIHFPDESKNNYMNNNNATLQPKSCMV